MTYTTPGDIPAYTHHETDAPIDTAPGQTNPQYLPKWVSTLLCLVFIIFGYIAVYIQGGHTVFPAIASFVEDGASTSSPVRSQNPTGNNAKQQPSSEIPGKEPAPNTLGHRQDEDMQKALDPFIKEYGDTLYMYAANLETSGYATHQPRTSVPSGSIYKLFLAGEVFQQKTDGALNVNQPSGVNGWTIAQCTQQMVQNSNNDCGEALRAKLGPKKVTRSLRKQGYTDTDITKTPAAETSARDVALILNRIYTEEYFTKAHTQKLDYYLKNQLYRFRIPEGIPREPAIQERVGTRNKTGDVYGYTNDAAIVLGENTDYILVILSGEWPSPTASSYVHRYISGTLYNYFNDTEYELPYKKPE